MTQIAAELDRMRFEVYKIQKDLRKREEMSNAMVHLLVESGVVPGKDTACRCGECRMVAVAMAEAGYLDSIRDKWWEREREG
jgi:hypothetical protein